jgi:flavin-dependent dehydrogenase
MNVSEVGIIGGGLAGLSLAIRLAMNGVRVCVWEQHDYPMHKVCGEYLSAEVLPYLQFLGVELSESAFPRIGRFQLTSGGGTEVRSFLRMGGVGVSRFSLDERLYRRAILLGVEVKTRSCVSGLKRVGDGYEVTTRNGDVFRCRYLVSAHGKKGVPDRLFRRPVSGALYVGVKWHFAAPWESDLVALHHFPGGYAGVSQVENKVLNCCALIQSDLLKSIKEPVRIFEYMQTCNPFLNRVLSVAEPLWEKPLAIAAVSFVPKSASNEGVAMLGDASGLIAPLSGNGMAIAIRSSALWAEVYLNHSQASAEQICAMYSRKMAATRLRMRRGVAIQEWFGKRWISEIAMGFLKSVPMVLPYIIETTHGKKIEVPD